MFYQYNLEISLYLRASCNLFLLKINNYIETFIKKEMFQLIVSLYDIDIFMNLSK